MAQKLIVIGAGMASGRALEHLFQTAPGAYDVTLFNAEPRGTYNRLMLSPVLAGEKTYDQIVTHDAAWYARHGVTCRFGERVARIDRAAKVVEAGNGETLAYDKLVIATGSTPFMIPLPGHELSGVIAYRDLEDTNRMIDLGTRVGARAVVIGGGLLGLEAAAGMAMRGIAVTVVHLNGHLMERQLDAPAGQLLQRALEARGIRVICGANSREIVGENGQVAGLRLDDGRILPCDLLVMAVGIRPNVALGQSCGLDVGRGIRVDDHMVTSDPDVLALGECVEHDGAVFGLVAPLYDQAGVLAATLAGQQARFVQQELSTKLKVTGCDLFSAGDFAGGEGREDIVFRDPARGIYRRLVLEGDRLVGAVFYGDTSDATWFMGLIRDRTPVGDMRGSLIFGPGYQGGIAPDPMEAVAALLADAGNRGCNGHLSKAIPAGARMRRPTHPLIGRA